MPDSSSSVITPIDRQVRRLAAMAYGEASPANNADEIFSLASVLERQRIARGYADITTFSTKDKTFSFVASDGNKRFKKLMESSDAAILRDAGMRCAVEAALNAMAGGADRSNGAYFWDGADIKTNYKKHAKVKVGIKFSDMSHNIYQIAESTNLVIKTKTVVKKDVATGKKTSIVEETGRFDHVYESTAAYGGTIFWKISPQYIQVMKAKEYK